MNAAGSLLVGFLLNALWQIPLVTAAVSACIRLSRGMPSRHQNTLWVLALVLGVGVPVGSVFRQPIQLSQSKEASQLHPGPVATAGDSSNVLATPNQRSHARSEIAKRWQWTVTLGPATGRGLVILYLVSLGYGAARLLWAWRRTLAMKATAFERPLSKSMAAVLARCGLKLRVPHPTILWSDEVPGPVTVGSRRPAIVLPNRLHRDDSHEVLTSVLGHEMAHLRRADSWLNLMCEILALPIAFHPATAWIMRQIRASREEACDDLVSDLLLHPMDYARSLIKMAGYMSGPNQFNYSMGVLGTPPRLEARIMRLVERKLSDKNRSNSLRFAIAVMVLAATALATSVPSLALAQSGEKVEEPSSSPARLGGVASRSDRALSTPLYTYDSHGRRDPFQSARIDVDPKVPTGLPGFAVENVALKGIVKTARGSTAMVVLLQPSER